MHFISSEHKRADKGLPLFELSQLSFSYPDGKEALRDISLRVYHGDRIALVGQNGSGKTTLVKHLNGLYQPKSGELLYKGSPMQGEQLNVVRLEVGVMFQDPDDHLFCNTLYDDVAFGPMNQGLPEDLVEERVKKALSDAGFADLMYKPAHLLSYGQKKRAAFAAIMAMQPAVLILDEPSANLDPKQEKIFRDMLAAYEGTIICINHDLLFLYGLCDRAVVMSEGRIHHDFSFNDLVSHPASLREHGLDFSFRFSCCNSAEPHVHGDVSTTADKDAEGRSATSTPLLELRDYCFGYPDGTIGLRGVNLTLWPGDSLALIGENGAGKSTLALVLLGLQQGQGEYLFDGAPLNKKRRRELWRRVGMVFQDSADQLFCPSCWEEVAFGPQQLGCDKKKVAERVSTALEQVRLSGYDKRVPLNISGGERKRLAIAAALSMRPEVLILDEPTAGLDPRGEALLLEIIKSLPMTIILISHDLFFVQSLCQRVVVMHQGRLIRDYPIAEFLTDGHLESVNQLDFTYKNSCGKKMMALQQ
jgi:energy-coupling factor transporter ATP-binding protein EcfA2